MAGNVFESIVEDGKWQLLWHGWAGVDMWRRPDYPGWSRQILSRCASDSERPDRVLLSVSGPYGENEEAWAEAIDATVDTILTKLPSVKQVVLQPVVGGPGGWEAYIEFDPKKRQEFRYRAAALRGGDFILLAQMPKPQSGWAQQYDRNMRPAWACRFEPPLHHQGDSGQRCRSTWRDPRRI